VFTIPLGEPQCLFSLPQYITNAIKGGPCDNIGVKCSDRCGNMTNSPAVTVCHCSGGSAIMQCADEDEPDIVHPPFEQIVGNGTALSNGTAVSDDGMMMMPIDVPELDVQCGVALACADCAALRGCGWCAGSEQCLAGELDEPPASCFSGDWLYASCFRDPQLQITTIGDDEVWTAGESKTLAWVWRNDVPVPTVAVAFRWAPDAPWLLLGTMVNNGTYTLRVPDGVPPSEQFQIMVQSIPLDASGQPVPVTAAVLAANGRAYATSPLISLQAPVACTGPNGEPGTCLSGVSCTTIGGAQPYATRRDPRESCETIADASVVCCTSGASSQKRDASVSTAFGAAYIAYVCVCV
jgi:hypothetical protein